LTTDCRPAALLLAPETPYPLAGGGALRTASVLHYLASRYHVDLIVFRQPGAPDPARSLPPGLVRSIHSIDLPPHRRTLPARALRNAARLARQVPPLVDRFAGFEAAIRDAIAGRRYDLAIVEHSWCAPYLPSLEPCCRRTVLNLHNIESRLHAHCAEAEHGAPAFAHRLFRQASLELERAWFPRFSEILAVSEDDARAVRSIAPSARVSVYPNSLPPTPRPPAADEEAIVFSGNMEYHPNRMAVRFFRREVWPRLRERWPRLVWRLIGKHAEGLQQFTSGDPRIEVQGQVDHAVRELARNRVAVVPLLAGSGTRLKILEAWAAGLPVVSTTIGAEGLSAVPETHLLIADGAASLAEAVSRLLACKPLRQSLGNSGRDLLEQEFTWDTVWKRLNF
jgi:glycosyltransferase involved in cell wall biosynthesis